MKTEQNWYLIQKVWLGERYASRFGFVQLKGGYQPVVGRCDGMWRVVSDGMTRREAALKARIHNMKLANNDALLPVGKKAPPILYECETWRAVRLATPEEKRQSRGGVLIIEGKICVVH